MAYSSTYLKSRTPGELATLARLPLAKDEVATSHRGFNNEANHTERGYIGTGNVSSGVQRSTFVRSPSTTRCNGRDFPAGDLWSFDMDRFRRTMPKSIIDRVRALSEEKDLIVYEFHSPLEGRREKTHGWLVTDTFYRHIETMCLSGGKSMDIMYDMQKRLSWKDEDAIDPAPVAELACAAAGMSLEELKAIAAEIGMEITDSWKSCRENGVYYSDEDPISAFRPDSTRDLVRSASPEEVAVMMCIRASVSPEDLVQMRTSFSALLDGDDDCPSP